MEFWPLTAEEIAAAPGWLAGSDLLPDRWRNDSTRAAGGWVNGHLIAVGRIYPSRIHTSRYFTDVEVSPGCRRQGHGRAMVNYLAGMRADPLPLATRGYRSSDAVAFARGLGARPYQTCPPQHVASAAFTALAAGHIPTLPASAVAPEQLQRSWVDTYTWIHATWSPVAPGSEQPLRDELANLDLDHSRVVAAPDPRAAAFVFTDAAEPVIVAECRTANEPDGLNLLRACVRDSLHSLSKAGITNISFDGHDTDPHFRPLLDELPTTGEPFELLAWNPSTRDR